MTISITNCWACDKPLPIKALPEKSKSTGKPEVLEPLKKRKIPRSSVLRGEDKYLFWCGKRCHDAYEDRVQKENKDMRQWSSFMCGEGECPKSMRHLIDIDQDVDVFDPAKAAVREKGGRVCGKCGESGHNARTCESRKAAMAAPKKKKAKKRKKTRKANVHGKKAKAAKKFASRRQYVCRLCGGLGHNARTCDHRPLEPGEFTLPPTGKKAKKKKSTSLHSKKVVGSQYTCGKCGVLGHNARTCKK